MGTNIRNVLIFEFKWLLKSWMFFVGIIMLVGLPVLIESPIMDGYTWISSSSSYVYSHAACIISAIFIPICVPATFHYEIVTGMTTVLFMQPIKKHNYLIGKILGCTFFMLLILMLGMVVQIFIPVFFGEYPYMPKDFIDAFIIYIIPTVLFTISLSYLSFMIFSSSISTVLTVAVFTLIQDILFPVQYRYIIRNENLEILAQGKELTSTFTSFLLVNRLANIGISLLFFLLAVVLYTIKNEKQNKGRI